jgi:hypothetical protein
MIKIPALNWISSFIIVHFCLYTYISGTAVIALEFSVSQ